MEGYEPGTYGDRIAELYDERYPEPEAGMVDRLAELATGGPALELGIGTGRVALPLAERGVEVHGIDASEAMVDRLRSKESGDRIPVTIGNMADLEGLGPFRMVFVVFNTFFGLLTQDDQIRCFRAVASVLEPGGRFVMEAFVPDPGRFDRGQRVSAIRVEAGQVDLEASRYDPTTQTVWSHHLVIGPDGYRMLPVKLRFSYPSELDLMARLAELSLVERWGGWNRQPYTGKGRHISVWQHGHG